MVMLRQEEMKFLREDIIKNQQTNRGYIDALQIGHIARPVSYVINKFPHNQTQAESFDLPVLKPRDLITTMVPRYSMVKKH